MKRKVLSVVLVFILLIPAMIPVYSYNSKIDKALYDYIEAYATELTLREHKIIDSYVLSGFNSNSYIAFKLDPAGYIVCRTDDFIIEEFVPDAEELPFDTKSNESVYYGGPMNFIKKDSSGFHDIRTGKLLSDEDITAIQSKEYEVMNSRTAKGPVIPDPPVIYNMPHYTYFTSTLDGNITSNNTGICTLVACEITVMYYDWWVNPVYLADGFNAGGTSVSNGVYDHSAVYDELVCYLGSDPIGLYAAAAGMNSYIQSRPFVSYPTAYSVLTNYVSVFNKVYEKLHIARPVIAAMFHSYNSQCPYDHSVVVYGYVEHYSGDDLMSRQYAVHTGWTSPSTGYFAYEWFADALYIND